MERNGYTFYLLDYDGNLKRTYHNCYLEVCTNFIRLYRLQGFNVAIINLASGDRIEQAEENVHV